MRHIAEILHDELAMVIPDATFTNITRIGPVCSARVSDNEGNSFDLHSSGRVAEQLAMMMYENTSVLQFNIHCKMIADKNTGSRQITAIHPVDNNINLPDFANNMPYEAA